ncbi:MAG TPA: hypothetical protein VK797_04715 [Tepidisphaeraceae bacterium]|nr:hypothetical protein [Tepidisphaeraceae bacterium]
MDYMLTGSMASSLQGEPRASHDLDLVVALTPVGVDALVQAFPAPRYYLDRQSIESTLQSTGPHRQFNLLDVDEGDKVDFWLLSEEPFDQSRFSRKYTDEINGLRVKISRPEDTILMKLLWAQMSGGSEKQFGDALSVYELQHAQLDLTYLERWARTLGVNPLWHQLKSRAKVV